MKAITMCLLTALCASVVACSDGGGGSGGAGGEGQGGEGQGGDGDGGMPDACFATTLDASLCDPNKTTFTLDSTNPYYPLTVGLATVLEGFDQEDMVQIRVERTVTAETKMVAGVETHVLEHRTYHDGEIHEVAINYYVEAVDGTVCYFGEDVSFYENGVVANHDGTWLANGTDQLPGIIMPASPAVGMTYFQESAPSVEAWDMGRVNQTGQTGTFAGQSYSDILVIGDSSPFDDCAEEEKRYIKGIGEVQDVEALLTEVTMP